MKNKSLFEETLRLLREDPRNTRQQADAFRVEKGFLDSIVSGRIKNPSVERIQTIWEGFREEMGEDTTEMEKLEEFQKKVSTIIEEAKQEIRNAQLWYLLDQK